MKRYKHNLSHYKLLTCDMGELIPVACFEALPGDTIQGHTAALVRVSPLVAPVMHPVTVRFHSWFVPHRLCWTDWEDFITGGPQGVGAASVFPTIGSGAGFALGSLADYFGIAPQTGAQVVSALPFRAYAQIYNEFYRDEDLCAEAPVALTGGGDAITNQAVKKIAWEKDYFTSARPWPQKGPDVSMPLGTQAPVISDGVAGPQFKGVGNPTPRNLVSVNGSAATNFSAVEGTGETQIWHDPNLIADLTNATAVNVNDVRRAFALQRYQEARARYGSRYTEYLRYLGVRPSDSRLQRPEYLGGGKQTISFSEVLRTGRESDQTNPEEGPIGEMKGHGIAAMRSRKWRRFIEEHGIVMTLMSVRPKTIYNGALHKMWLRRTKEDFWQRELEQIGQQEVDTMEIYADPANQGLFGYQDRYAEYKHLNSGTAADFRTTLDYWHLARKFGAPPVLNQSFVECDPTKRIHAVQTEDVLWCMVNNNVVARRMVRTGSSSRIY